MTFRRIPGAVAALAFLAAPGGAAGQACPNGEISHVFVDNHSIFDLDELPTERLQWVYELVNSIHIPTRRSFIRRELLVGEGDCYDAYLLADSERILRRFPFISNADVYGLQQDDGSWHVVADTRDEWSTRVEVTAGFENGIDLRRVALAEQNFLGYGVSIRAFLVEDNASRQIGGEAFTPQLLGTEVDLRIGGGETRIGSFYGGELSYPFLGEVGRWAWRASGSLQKDYFDYSSGVPGSPGHVLLPIEDKLLEATVARRVGEPGDLTTIGVGLSREEVSAPGFPGSVRVVEGQNFDDLLPAEPAVAAELEPQVYFASGTRLNLLFGHRNIRFIQRSGLDALRGVSDVELGSDVSLTLSRTIAQGFGRETPDDLGVRVRFYAGGASGEFVAVSHVALDARQIFFAPGATRSGWRDLIAEGDVLVYYQPRELERHTFLARLAGAGGWTVDRPFQLTLGGSMGVRGYEEQDLPGARRLILNLEDRVYLGWPAKDLFDFGLTLFADVGHMWAGEVPFGRDSGFRGSLGAGLRIGFPAGSRDVARIDLAWPVHEGGIGNSPVFRIALVDLIGLQRGLVSRQVQRTRLQEIGVDSFTPRR